MARVIRSTQAQRDLGGILDYLDSQNIDVADRFAIKFDQTCEPNGRSPEVNEGKVHRCRSAGPVPRDFDQYGSSAVFPRWHEADSPGAQL